MVAGVSLLIALQLFSRLVTFALNAVLARSLGPKWYALGNVQLQLVSASALFLAKEGVRRACQRIYPGGRGPALGRAVNLAWAAVPLTALSGAAVAATSARVLGDAEGLVSAAELRWAVWTVCAAAVLEAAAEPLWLYAQANEGLLSRRVIAEGAALALKAALTAWLALRVGAGAGAFAYAQLAFAGAFGALLLALLRRARAPLRELLPRRRGAALEGDERALAAQVLWQCAQKYALTEGERLVIVALTGMTEQGVYALVSNLGSLVARLVLQPVEEATFAHYSRLAAAAPPDAAALRRMVALVRAAAIFGGVFAAFGPAYSWLLLRLLYGPLWSSTDAPAVLQAYCAHVCAIALNGVTEAFVHATATRDELQKLNVLLVALSVAYVPAAAVGLTTFGARGLIAANCANVALRTAYSLRFIRRRVDGAAAKEDGGAAEVRMLPHPAVLGALAASAAATLGAGAWVGGGDSLGPRHAVHVLCGGGCLVGVALAVYRCEPELAAQLRALRRKKSV